MPAYIPADDIPHLPSLNLPLVEVSLDTPSSPLRSNSALEREKRLSLLHEGHQHIRDTYNSPSAPPLKYEYNTPEKRSDRPPKVSKGPMRTRDMASRLASNFNRARWDDDSMWTQLARAVNQAGGARIDPAQLPQAIRITFSFLGPTELEKRVRTLLEWNRNLAPESAPESAPKSAPKSAPDLVPKSELPETPQRSIIR